MYGYCEFFYENISFYIILCKGLFTKVYHLRVCIHVQGSKMIEYDKEAMNSTRSHTHVCLD